VPTVEMSTDRHAGLSSGGTNEVKDLVVAVEGFAGQGTIKVFGPWLSVQTGDLSRQPQLLNRDQRKRESQLSLSGDKHSKPPIVCTRKLYGGSTVEKSL
jgi:hypothetical protein